MTIKYEDVKKRLLSIPEEHIFFGEKSSLLDIKEAEERLGNKLLESFKQYLMEFGYTGIDGIEILVVGKKIEEADNIVDTAFNEWEGCKLDYYIPKYLIPFSPTGTGDYYCFDARSFEEGECPVVYYSHDEFYEYVRKERVPETTHRNFIEWLNDSIDSHFSENKV